MHATAGVISDWPRAQFNAILFGCLRMKLCSNSGFCDEQFCSKYKESGEEDIHTPLHYTRRSLQKRRSPWSYSTVPHRRAYDRGFSTVKERRVGQISFLLRTKSGSRTKIQIGSHSPSQSEVTTWRSWPRSSSAPPAASITTSFSSALMWRRQSSVNNFER